MEHLNQRSFRYRLKQTFSNPTTMGEASNESQQKRLFQTKGYAINAS
jgi:hypothetical protein